MKRASQVKPALWYVTGGKGGVGKSTVTVNLAVELSRRGRKVLLCDLDLGLANVDVMLRVPTSYTLVDAVSGRAELSDCISTGPCGVHLIAGAGGSQGRCRATLGSEAGGGAARRGNLGRGRCRRGAAEGPSWGRRGSTVGPPRGRRLVGRQE